MPELMDGAFVFGFLAFVLCWIFGRRKGAARRLPFLAMVAIVVAAAYLGPPGFGWVQTKWRATPILPDVTEGMVFIGLFAALVSLTVFERKGGPRRVPYWAGALIAVMAAFGLPPVLDWTTGAYQNASIRADVNQCTAGMKGEVQPREVSNICDFAITVGMCLPGEENPEPCRQSVTLEPGGVARFEPGEARLAFAPGNRDGLTVVACRPPHRPSRMLANTLRHHEGVCLPGL